MIVDTVFDTTANSYRLTEIHHTGGHTLRVRVHRDFYLHQSHAVAEILTADLTWTELAHTPAGDWHRRTPTRAGDAATLQPVAEHLAARAHRILTPPAPAEVGNGLDFERRVERPSTPITARHPARHTGRTPP